MMISFPETPDIGTIMLIDEQAFELCSTRPHRRKDGAMTELLVWQSICPVCGNDFEVSTTLQSSGVSRRCANCRQPGKPVKGKRGRKVKVEIVTP